MNKVDIKQVSSLLEKYNQTERPVIITRDGQPVAAMFPLEKNIDLETFSLSINQKFIEIIEQSRKSQQEEGRIFLDEI
jgi:PHD/YefM family antitoxin component YafN of YafNO toxin-antitoxin module